MPLPVLVRKQAEMAFVQFCAARLSSRGGVLTHAAEGACFTLFEIGEISSEATDRVAVARFCYSEQLGQWTVHCPDTERQWRFYPNAGPSLNLHKLLRHVEEDPFGAFWP
jgi:hypothetical protein